MSEHEIGVPAATHESAMRVIRDEVRKLHAETHSIEETLGRARARTAAVHGVIIDHAIGLAIRELIYEARNRERGSVRRASLLDADARSTAGAAMLASILETWMVGAKALGDCTGAELDAAAAWEATIADGHLRNIAFYRSLRAMVGDEERVREKIDHERAAALLSEACGTTIITAQPIQELSPRASKSSGPSGGRGTSMVELQPRKKPTPPRPPAGPEAGHPEPATQSRHAASGSRRRKGVA